MKKNFICFLCLSLLFSAMGTALAENEALLGNGRYFPLDAPVALTAWVVNAQADTSVENSQVLDWIEKKAGVTLQITREFQGPDAKRQLNLCIETEAQLPDILLCTRWTKAECALYGMQGLVLPLDDYLKECENWNRLNDICGPEHKTDLIMPDGHIYCYGTVNECFDMSTCREFTVEAGRPDTITEDKLISLKENNVDRISINPQTLSDSVLKTIGRKHTAEQFLQAFELARRCGFKNINTDLIAGLPTDTVDSFKRSLDTVTGLGAECVTVHTLCMKRAANLTTEGKTLNRDEALAARAMQDYARQSLLSLDYIPYYLYRQTRMVGNLENVGWSKRGYESLYNVYVMDETHTILACGSGGVTKLKRYGTDYLTRIFNFKYPYEYIDRFDELLNRKTQITQFYGSNAVDYSAQP